MANINVRIDANIKRKAEDIFESMGLTPSAAINLFYVQVIRTKSIPFELRADIPNATTLAAMKEVDQMAKKDIGKTFNTVEELMENLDFEVMAFIKEVFIDEDKNPMPCLIRNIYKKVNNYFDDDKRADDVISILDSYLNNGLFKEIILENGEEGIYLTPKGFDFLHDNGIV